MPTSRALFMLIAALLVNTSCATQGNKNKLTYETWLDKDFNEGFKNFETPSKATLSKQLVFTRTYRNTAYDDIWTAALVVLMQGCTIVHASKADGIVVCLNDAYTAWGPPDRKEPVLLLTPGMRATSVENPMAVLVERGSDAQVVVRADWLRELLERVDRPGVHPIDIDVETRYKFAEKFFDRVATQVFARRRWQSLLN